MVESSRDFGWLCGFCRQRYDYKTGAQMCEQAHQPRTISPDTLAEKTQAEPAGIDATLAERGSRYGVFAEHARIAQNVKAAMVDSPNWATLAPDQREALEMIAHKAARILNGDPDFHDSWHDIVGYTKLVADRLLKSSV